MCLFLYVPRLNIESVPIILIFLLVQIKTIIFKVLISVRAKLEHRINPDHRLQKLNSEIVEYRRCN